MFRFLFRGLTTCGSVCVCAPLASHGVCAPLASHGLSLRQCERDTAIYFRFLLRGIVTPGSVSMCVVTAASRCNGGTSVHPLSNNLREHRRGGVCL